MQRERTPYECSSWYLAFFDQPWRGQDPRAWWERFIAKGFGHVMAYGYCVAARQWVVVDWTKEGLSVMLPDRNELAVMIAWIKTNGVIMEVPAAEFRESRYIPRLPFYCVSMVKHLIGLDCWAVTPRQLYRQLRKRGFRERFAAVAATHPGENTDGRPRKL